MKLSELKVRTVIADEEYPLLPEELDIPKKRGRPPLPPGEALRREKERWRKWGRMRSKNQKKGKHYVSG